VTYNIGDLVRLTVVFTDIAKVPENPTTVVLEILAPDGTTVTPPAITNPTTGTFYADLPIAQSGIYKYRYTGNGSVQAVQEGQIVVSPSSLYPVPDIDLTTLEIVKDYLTVCDSKSDTVISWAITSASIYWLWRTGQGNADGSVPTHSPYVSPQPYSEWYDGNGNDRLFLRHSPIVSVQALNINGVAVRASSTFGDGGFVVDQNGRSLTFRSSGSGVSRGVNQGYGYAYSSFFPACGFSLGTQNIQVQYTAGFVTTPLDINEAVTEMVALTVKRRGWLDFKQQAMPDTIGTITYRDWIFTPKIISVMENYARRAQV